MAFEAPGIVEAARRWLILLRNSNFQQARQLILNDSSYTDLTETQYASAIDWLLQIGVLVRDANFRGEISLRYQLEEEQLRRVVFEEGVALAKPPWLRDADQMIKDVVELPEDVIEFGASLGIGELDAYLGVQKIHGRADLEKRSEIGRAGEELLVAMLERLLPGSIWHVAREHDGFGYDVEVSLGGSPINIEVKSTTRKGRLSVFVSRHEYEMAKVDPNWILVVVGLEDLDHIGCLATLKPNVLEERAPSDRHNEATWQSARFDLGADDLEIGIEALSLRGADATPSELLTRGSASDQPAAFAWMPRSAFSDRPLC